jgi:hypothetical protein
VRTLALVFLAGLLGCAPSTGHYLVRESFPPGGTFVLTVVDGSATAHVGSFCGPLAVLVTQDGNPIDGVTVNFSGGIGSMTSGDDSWTISGPGTGIAAVGCIPRQRGTVVVTAQVGDTVSSWSTGGPDPDPQRTSNVVTLLVTGQ